jgi:hypothetical protein
MKNLDQKVDCKRCREYLADLLLEDGFAASHPEFAVHMKACAGCAGELAALRSTFALLDGWTAPEPSPYFDAKVEVRLREELAAPPEGLWERVRSFIIFSTGRTLRPAMAGALAVAMLAGGGGAVIGMYHPAAAPASAYSPTVNDLRILDNNAQALQQMDQLLDDSGTDDATAQPTT